MSSSRKLNSNRINYSQQHGDESFEQRARNANSSKKISVNMNSKSSKQPIKKSLVFEDQKSKDYGDQSYSNYDRDDSLYDALSLGMQTPFRPDYINFDINDQTNQDINLETCSKLVGNNSEFLLNESLIENQKEETDNRYSLIDYEFVKNSKNPKTYSPKFNNPELSIDLKDTSIDEILLIADDSGTARIAEYAKSRQSIQSNRKSKSPSKIPIHTNASRSRASLNTSSNTSRHNPNQSNSSSSKIASRSALIDSSTNLEYFAEIRRSERTPSPNRSQIQFGNESFSNEIANINLENSFEKYISPYKETEDELKNGQRFSNIEKLRERVNSINFSDFIKKEEPLFDLIKTPQPDLILDEDLSSGNSKNEGAFKLYTTNLPEESHSELELEPAEERTKINSNKSSLSKPVSNNRASPFVSIDKPNIPTSSSSNLSKTNKTTTKMSSTNQLNKNQANTRGPIKKYRSGSTSSLNINAKSNKAQMSTERTGSNYKQAETERIRPATHTEVTYTLDSDESTIIDNLINDPEKLKKKLKQGKMDREQLNQLQENYLRLLEQYAEAENFIDTFRLGGQFYGNAINTGSLVTNDSKSQLNAGSFQIQLQQQQQIQLQQLQQSRNYIQSSAHSSKTTLNSNTQQTSKLSANSLGGSKLALPTGDNNSGSINKNQIIVSLANTPTLEASNKLSERNTQNLFKSTSVNTFETNQNLKRSQSTVYIIPTNRASTIPFITTSDTVQREESNSPFGGSQASQNNNQDINNSPIEEENIIIDPISRLGILVQIKVLEDKMQSFLTLVNENQLSKTEQRQVYDSIKNDYENLLKNYEEVKKNDSNGLLPEELDMDVDLNKELGKMKDLLNDIVQKMSDNLIEQSPTGSVISQEKRPTQDSSQSGSVYDNHDEIMDQYNRLLDVFNEEQVVVSTETMEKLNNAEDLRQSILSSIINTNNQNQQKSSSDSMSQSRSNKQQDKRRESQLQNIKQSDRSDSNSDSSIQAPNNQNSRIFRLAQRNDKNNSKRSNSFNKKLSRISGSNDSEETDKEDYENEEPRKVEKPNEFKTKTEQLEQVNRTMPTNNRKLKLVRMSKDTDTTTGSSEIQFIHQSKHGKQASPVYAQESDQNENSSQLDASRLEENYKNYRRPAKIQRNASSRQQVEMEQQQMSRNSKPERRKTEIIQVKPNKPSVIYSESEEDFSDQNENDKTLSASYSNSVIYQQRPDENKNSQRKSTSKPNQENGGFTRQLCKKSMSSVSLNQKPNSGSSFRDQDKIRINGKIIDLKNLPVAKAYEGSDSGEDLDSFNYLQDKREQAFSSVVNDQQLRKSNQNLHRHYSSQMNIANCQDNSSKHVLTKKQKKSSLSDEASMDVDEMVDKRFKFNSLKPKDTYDEPSRGTTTEIESIMERKPVVSKSSKKDMMMKKLTEEVEFLKQEILKKHMSKLKSSSSSSGNENERKKFRSQQIIETTDSPLTDSSELDINRRARIKEQMDPHRNVPTQPKENKIRRYQSINDVYSFKNANARSLENVNRHSFKHKAPRENYYIAEPSQEESKMSDTELDTNEYLSRNQLKRVSSGYSIPIIKEYAKVRPAPVPVLYRKPSHLKEEFYYDSNGCLVCLPKGSTQRSSSSIPINLIPYPLNEIDSNIVDESQALQHNAQSSLRKSQSTIRKSSSTSRNDPNLVYHKSGSSQQIKNQDSFAPHVNSSDKVYVPVDSNSTNASKKGRKVRYYIREYTDISTVSDNEIVYRRDGTEQPKLMPAPTPVPVPIVVNKEKEKRTQATPEVKEIDTLLDRAFKYAHSISKKAKQIKNKLTLKKT